MAMKLHRLKWLRMPAHQLLAVMHIYWLERIMGNDCSLMRVMVSPRCLLFEHAFIEAHQQLHDWWLNTLHVPVLCAQVVSRQLTDWRPNT